MAGGSPLLEEEGDQGVPGPIPQDSEVGQSPGVPSRVARLTGWEVDMCAEGFRTSPRLRVGGDLS